jgi:hypothetical protein
MEILPILIIVALIASLGMLFYLQAQTAFSLPPFSFSTPSSCLDGTSYDECSIQRPEFCRNGTLVDYCSQCGCDENSMCNSTTGSCEVIIPQNCSDGTVYNNCSTTKPKYCYRGILQDRADICGCPTGKVRDDYFGCTSIMCYPNDMKSCKTSDNCNGFQTCSQNAWGDCLKADVTCTGNNSQWNSGADMTYWMADSQTTRLEVIQSSKPACMNTIFVDAKDVDGKIAYYYSGMPSSLLASSSWNSNTSNPIYKMMSDAHANNMRIAVRFSLFNDEYLSSRNSSLSIKNPGNVRTNWVDPACQEVRNWEISLLENLVKNYDVDEINLDFSRYPDPGVDVSTDAVYPCLSGNKTTVINNFVRDAYDRIKDINSSVKVSVSVFGRTADGPDNNTGQSIGDLRNYADFIYPMLYPDYAGISCTDLQASYSYVNSKTVASMLLGGNKIIPWVQGFGSCAGNTDAVGNQIKAVKDANTKGVAVWWFVSMGTSNPVWNRIANFNC